MKIFHFGIFAFTLMCAVLLAACPGIANNSNDDASLKSLTVDDQKVAFGKPGASIELAEAVDLTLSITGASTGVTVNIVPNSSKAGVVYGKMGPDDGAPILQNSGTVKFNTGDFLVIRISAGSGKVLYYKVRIQVGSELLGKVLILQVYGTGDNYDGGVSHSFIELYNKSPEEADLSGYSLQYSGGGTSWQTLNLNGKKIPAGHSFLVLGKKMNERNDAMGIGLLQLEQSRADMSWNNLQMDNKKFKVLLLEGTAPVTVRNPFDVEENRIGTKIEGYIDFIGTNSNDETGDIDAFETSRLNDTSVKGPYIISKGKSARRVDLTDTDDNHRDFQQVEWRPESGQAISDEDFEALRPRSTRDGAWNPVYTKSPTGNANADIGSLMVAGLKANPGMPASSYLAVTSPGSVTITNLVAGSAPLDIVIAPGATFRTAKVSGSGAPQWDDIPSPVYSFSDGDFLYIEVTSRNGNAINVFKIVVNVSGVSSAVNISGTYTLNLNSSYAQQCVFIEAYSTQAALNNELVSRVEANISDKTWSLQVPSGQAVWFKVIVTDSTGYTFSRVVSPSAQTYTGNTPGVILTLGPFALPELKTFTLINADANNNTKQNKTAAINQTSGIISFEDTSFNTVSVNTIIYFYKLSADFTLSPGSKLYVGNVEQKSGITSNNYYDELIFTVVSEDNVRKDYTVPAPVPGTYRVVNTRSFQTQGFGVLNITTGDKTTGIPTGNATKLNLLWNPTGTYTYMGPEGRVLIGGTSIKARGNWSYRFENPKSFTLGPNEAVGFDYYDFETGEYVTLPESKRWALRINSGDSSRIKDSLCREMGRRVLTHMGWQPHADWVFLFLNDEYKGLYNLIETLRIEEGRFNIGPPASPSIPNGGFIVEMNNNNWYADDFSPLQGTSNYVFDSLYNFITSHQNSGSGIVWAFETPDSNLGWYYPDPPNGNGNLNYSDTIHFPVKGIALGARLLSTGKSKPPGEWIVPDDFGQPNGMGTTGMKNGGLSGSRTLDEVYPDWQSSAFVTMSKFIQDAEDAIYAHNWGSGGVGGYHDFIDVDSFIDWHIAAEMTSDWEIISMNGRYMHFDSTIGKLKMGPLWDLDKAFQRGERGANPGFIKDTRFWSKELLKDPYYVSRLKARWAVVRTQFNTELDSYIDAQNTRFSRITGYNHPSGMSISGNRTGLKATLTDMRGRMDTVFNGY